MVWKLISAINRLRAAVWSWQSWVHPVGNLTMVLVMALLIRAEIPGWSPVAQTALSASAPVRPATAVAGSTAPAVGVTGTESAAAATESPLLPSPAPMSGLTPLAVDLDKVSVLQEAKSPVMQGTIDEMPLSFVSRLPERLGRLEGENRKKIFIGSVLPTVMVAVNEVRQERRQLLAILDELGSGEELFFAEEQTAWQDRLGADKARFILSLVRKYRTASATELVAMVNVLPPSLIIAQGAIESSWGGSRYAVEANNLFGMYSGAGSRIMEYETILDSVRAYVLNINRLPAYRELRRIRSQTLDPMLIADGLSRYSERKEYYINDVKQIIALNKLQDYDALIHTAG